MKKILICISVLAFIVACGSSPDYSDVDVPAELENYEGACADIAFKDTRDKLDEVNVFVSEGRTGEANDARDASVDLFNAGVLTYNDLKSSIDRASADLENQKTRLANIQADAKKYAPKDYANSVKKINSLHDLADKGIDECNVPAVEVAVAGAEKELSKLEALVAARTDKAAPVSGITYIVKKGDCLWKIAADKLANPYFWPLIYWSNKDSIKDPDLIYPNQKFTIESSYDDSKKAQAQKFAKTRGAWSLYDNK